MAQLLTEDEPCVCEHLGSEHSGWGTGGPTSYCLAVIHSGELEEPPIHCQCGDYLPKSFEPRDGR